MITVFFSTDANSAETTLQSIFEEVGGRKAVKPGHLLINLDGHHFWKLLKLLKAEGHFSWKDGPLPMPQIKGQDAKSIKQTETINLSKMLSSRTAFVQMDTSFVDGVKGCITHQLCERLQLQRCMKSPDARIKHNVDEMLRSNFLPTWA